MEGFGIYSYELVRRITENHPEQSFVLFFDRPIDSKLSFTSNVKQVVLFPPTRHPLLYITWFEWSLKRALKKQRIDLLWTPDGFCSLGTTIPQVATIHDLNFEHYPKDLPWLVSRYFRYFFPKFAVKAQHIITVSFHSKMDISQTYGIKEEKISVVYNGIQEGFRVHSEEEIEATRQAFTQGRPYFLFVGSLHPRKNVKRLVEAFQEFCQTNTTLDLTIVGNAMWKQEEFNISGAATQRIHFLGQLERDALCKIMGAAFALSYVPYFEGFGIPLVESMQSGLPIISANTSCLPEIAGDAAIYCDPFSISSITAKMTQLANDSTLHSQLTKHAKERAAMFSWDQAAIEVWNILIKSMDS